MSPRTMAIFLALALAGCGGGEIDDLKQWVEKSGEGMRGRVEPLPTVKPMADMEYNPEGLQNPFAPRTSDSQQRDCAKNPDCLRAEHEKNRAREALESYPLESLKMVGTLERSKQRWALIKTPENNLYKITAGNHMGQNFGTVSEITEAQVTIKELVQDGNGIWTQREAALQLIEEETKK